MTPIQPPRTLIQPPKTPIQPPRTLIQPPRTLLPVDGTAGDILCGFTTMGIGYLVIFCCRGLEEFGYSNYVKYPSPRFPLAEVGIASACAGVHTLCAN